MNLILLRIVLIVIMQLKIKTEDFFGASDNYETICPHCKGKVTFSGIKKQLDQLKRQFESLGITW